ncbi:hypothetical protein XENTR_v10012826 [Xenopus tropicalis]|uniref:Uncharacterized protein LOC101731301 n=1 Tax=Xenopus tropicalis TaxID=8364 RepID=A0A8J0T3V0_XENTR|nr:uncharacterized protein LOC101731301 [Xenopus tropicalis]KAE8612352.1 hypothetical protein XENTR_v10012826 [Xenopus tropicalis]KAE8612353.1 hypothetical protein XENTR_v10012826 [Xenopus tropicalis]KAE8612354.1 hypothetical protein XENTR_v10012826 [Xenopus tropicalis]KAE8612355.1 hypothetical protein XENTR_v10012826 [Xenopus tropicalis]|eukprot:XP_017949182.1 PREDICTED: uncharacterized protein LOC101731301 [Xenopus tropicalis]
MDGEVEKNEASDEKSSLESEDFFLSLTEEERECLQYLLETIDSLEDDNQEDSEDSNINQADAIDDLANSAQHVGNLDRNQRGLSESCRAADQTDHETSLSKMRIIKSFSEDFPGCSITVTSDTGHKLASSHPSHLRKFDTIMRSGVNVQELRARFIRQQEPSPVGDHTRGTGSAGTKVPPMSRNLKSPRQEALQKLGLLKRKQSNSSACSSPEPHQPTEPSSASLNGDIKQTASKGGNGPLEKRSGKPGAMDRCWPP